MRIFIALLVAIASVGNASGQSFINLPEEHRFFGGLNLGCNFSQIDGDVYFGYHKIGFRGGPQVFARLAPNFATSLSLIYAQKGCLERTFVETSLGPALFEYRIHLQYVEMPLQAHYFQGPHWMFNGGLAYGRLVDAKEDAFSLNPIKIDPELYPFKKDEWSFMIGIGYRFYRNWMLTGHYQYSLANIREGDQLPPPFSLGPEFNNMINLQVLILLGTGLRSEK